MKRIVILGAGESGAGAAVLAKVKGFETFVSDMSAIKDKYKELLDSHAIAWEEGHHTEELILNAEISGIPDKTDDPAENGRVWLLVSIYRDLAKKVRPPVSTT